MRFKSGARSDLSQISSGPMLNTCSQKGRLMPTSIRLAAETDRRLDRLASETGRSKAFYLREIIERGLQDMEDYYLAAAVLERVRKGEEQVYSLEEVERELGLAD